MFRTIRITVAALAVAIAGLSLAGVASAHARGIAYEFRGTAVVAPGSAATQIQVQVTGGNRQALKALRASASGAKMAVSTCVWATFGKGLANGRRQCVGIMSPPRVASTYNEGHYSRRPACPTPRRTSRIQ